MPIVDLEPGSLGLESLLCHYGSDTLGQSLLSLGLISKTEVWALPPRMVVRIKQDTYCRGPERARGCLESHSRRVEQILGFLFPAPFCLSRAWGPRLGLHPAGGLVCVTWQLLSVT